MDRNCCNCVYYKKVENLISRPIITVKSICDKILRRKKEMQFIDTVEIFELCGRFGDAGMPTHHARGYTSIGRNVPYFEEFHRGPCGLDGKYWQTRKEA